MIKIVLSDKNYENDVYPLVKAFYPEQMIKIYSEEEWDGPKEKMTSVNDQNIKETVSLVMDGKGFLYIEFHPGLITLTFKDESGRCSTQTQRMDASLPRSQYKNAIKRFLYHVMEDSSDQFLPWGILTGIRPTKLVYEMLVQGCDEKEIYDHMNREYLCSEEKVEMSLHIADREAKLLRELDYQNGYSLYIGIPFCPTTCSYCSFPSYPLEKHSGLVEDYLKALEKEIVFAASCFPKKQLTTVYFGGGTPTSLSTEQLEALIRLVKKNFDFTQVKELCVEAGRPDSITREKLVMLKNCGVDRISINPQSMQQKTLEKIGRRHSVEEVKRAFYLARETGHMNINMDIILGLPGENPCDVTDTLKQIKELNPESLTVHTLAIKRAARLNQEKTSHTKSADVSKMLKETITFAEENEYYPYYLYRQKNMAGNLENIGYSKYGKEGLYNILIMEEKQTILALGAGGMSKFVFYEENRIERVDNVKSVTDYINRIDEMIARKLEFLKKHNL